MLISQKSFTIGGNISHVVLTIFGYHTHPDPRFENPKVLFGKIPKINTLVRLEVKGEFASIPDKGQYDGIRRKKMEWRNELTTDTLHRQFASASPSVRPFLCKSSSHHTHPGSSLSSSYLSHVIVSRRVRFAGDKKKLKLKLTAAPPLLDCSLQKSSLA